MMRRCLISALVICTVASTSWASDSCNLGLKGFLNSLLRKSPDQEQWSTGKLIAVPRTAGGYSNARIVAYDPEAQAVTVEWTEGGRALQKTVSIHKVKPALLQTAGYSHSQGARITPADQKFFVRDPATAVRDPNYIPNAVESIDYFDSQLADLSRVSGNDLAEMTKKMHVVAAYGKNRDRIYSGATGKEVEPGNFWQHLGLKNARPSREYAREVAQGLKIQVKLQDGPVPIGNLPQEALPQNLEGRHFYPASQYFKLYFDHGAKLLNRLGTAQPGSQEAVQLIAEYYHTMANARPFNTINNSLFFNQANYLLRRYGFEAMPQGYLDHLAHQLRPEDFVKVFQAQMNNRLPLPSAEIRSGL